MVGKKTLKSYDFQSMDEYYTYIYESMVNGQKKQTIQLYKKLSEAQKAEFFRFLDLFAYFKGENPVLKFLDYIN